ncbi:synaptotagmin-6 [Orussus abietinus]|uniref:synaptotagmin-6 n=1 Tax=Orussus abietinus TaxID=222816 RepID=UPI000626747B|nr:synaptotagmin-6 [Orussus abietinus]
MVSSAILGAATGTGLALVVAMTIVVYRYYAAKRKGKHWSDLDRWRDPPPTKPRQETHYHHSHCAPTSRVLDCWNKPQNNYCAVQSEKFNVTKEQYAVQPITDTGAVLPHQSRSYPGGSGGGRTFGRNSSVGCQSSLEGASGPSVHRGSSPQIRAFGPDGRHHHVDPIPTASSYPPDRSSRPPSPARAASVDARCGSPANCSGVHSGTVSPSQGSIASLATGAGSSCGSPSVTAPRPGRSCRSPLLIPPPRSSNSNDCGPTSPSLPLGTLQPDLYQQGETPLFLSSCRDGKSLGRLHLRLKYDFKTSDLRVHLIEAHDLAGINQGGFNKPYVKVTLVPEVDSRERQTSVFENNPNPVFDQDFKFAVSQDDLQEKTLILQIFDHDHLSRNDVVGTVRVSMDELQLVPFTYPTEIWGEIARDIKPPEARQEVLVSLSYLPNAEKLEVGVLEARNLFPPENKETLDPYCKVSLLFGDRRVKKWKTAPNKMTRHPVWNEARSFKISASTLLTAAVEICVLDSNSDLNGGNVIVGSCILGPAPIPGIGPEAGNNQGREHWLHVTRSPGALSMWHTLH